MRNRFVEEEMIKLVSKAFEEGGVLQRHLKGYKHNPLQLDYARRIAGFLADRNESVGALEAGTGTGKTLGYLVPAFLYAALFNERIAISTFTRHLQKQILEKEAILAAKVCRDLTGKVLSAAPRYGRAAFVSQGRLQVLYELLSEERTLTGPEQLQFAALRKVRTFADYFVDHYQLPAGVKEDDICLLPTSSVEESEDYYDHLEEIDSAHVVVVTHASLAIEAARGTILRDADDLLPKFKAVIVDEADRFATAASGYSDLAVGLLPIRHFMQGLKASGMRGAGPAIDRIDALANYLGRFVDEAVKSDRGHYALLAGLTPSRKRKILDHAEDLAEIMKKAEGWIKKNNGNDKEAHFVAVHLQYLSRFIKYGEKTIDGLGAALRFSPLRNFPSFALKSLDPGRLLRNLFNREEGDGMASFNSIILTSATLDAPSFKNPDEFFGLKQDLGLFDRQFAQGSGRIHPDKFGTMEIVLPLNEGPTPTLEGGLVNEGWLDYSAKAIALARSLGGRSLVVTTSYDDALELAKRQSGPVLVHYQGQPLRPLLDRYVKEEGACLISPAIWEGVDLPGLVDHLIIPKIPFLPPDLLKEEIAVNWAKAKGGNIKQARTWVLARQLAETRRKLCQGIGRGIRKSDDKTMLWLLDSRCYSGKNILASIPVRFRTGIKPALDQAGYFDGTSLLNEKPVQAA